MYLSIAFVALCTLSFVRAGQTSCFREDDNHIVTDSIFVPCNQNTEFSMCYRVGTNENTFNYPPDLGCLPSGITISNTTISGSAPYWRGSCTDRTWGSKYCLNAFNNCPNDRNGNAAVTPCDKNAATSTTWCCGQSNSTCCGTSAAIRIALTIGLTSTTSTSSTTSTTPSPTSSQVISPTTLTSSATPTHSRQASGLSTGVKAGVGAAAAVGAVIAIGIATWLIMRRRKSRYRTEGGFVSELPELDTKIAPKEMDALHPMHEMEGSKGIREKEQFNKDYDTGARFQGVPAELGDGLR